MFNMILQILQHRTHGFFVECGAGNGRDQSNSLFFELKRSWTGLLIEPNPSLFLKILETKKKAYTINCCLSTKNQSQIVNFVPWYYFGGILNAYDNSHLKWLKQHPGFNKKRNITTQCFTLYSILLALGQTHVDYFSLDLEGPELGILRTIPFDKITIDVLSVEYKVTCDDKKEWVTRSFEKLQRLRKFFKRLGNYKEVAILPWGSAINPDKEEGKGLDVIFKRIR